jgi:iron-sulfur cluster repair protein YtfE (RIC family)
VSPEQQRLQHLLISAADHEILSHSIECFRRLFAGERSLNAAAEFTAIKRLLNEKLPEHFAYEDQHVFPALLAGNPPPPVVEQIMALTCEHTALLDEARRLNALLARSNLATCTGELWMALLDFFEGLEKHSANEDALMMTLSSRT